jgi:hypothetical protein
MGLRLLSIAALAIVIGVLLHSRLRPRGASPHTPVRLPGAHHAGAQPPAGGSPSGSSASDTVEICGHGSVAIAHHDSDSVMHHIRALIRGAQARWLAALLDSGDLRARVAGLLLSDRLSGEIGGMKRLPEEEVSEAIVQLAAGAGDPAVYAMAVSMCGTWSGAPANTPCQQISLRQWARLEPDNAVPWLLLAGAALADHDRAGEADAFTAAVNAHHFDSYSQSLLAFTEAELPQDLTALERAALAVDVIGIEAATVEPEFTVLSLHCSKDAVQDAGIRQQCSALAELLVSQDSSLLYLMVGKMIGARTGWPAARVNALQEELDALMEVSREAGETPEENPWSCEAVRRTNASLAQRLRLGEVGAARAALARSGEPQALLAQKFRQNLDRIPKSSSDNNQ